MKRAFAILASIAMLAAAGWFIRGLFPTDESVILRQLKAIERLASYGADEPALAKFANVSKLKDYLSPNISLTVDVGAFGLRSAKGRDEIFQGMLGARNQLSALRVEFNDVTVTVAEGRSDARVRLTAQVWLGPEKSYDAVEVQMNLERLDGDWKISSIETLRTLRR